MTDTTAPASLVSSDNVNGTAVFGADGTEIGHIDHLMIDKVSGNVAYAVMGFGGLLGLGEDHHPIPWKKLRYDTSRGGFVTDITREQIEGAPERPSNWESDREYRELSYRHYGVPPYWV